MGSLCRLSGHPLEVKGLLGREVGKWGAPLRDVVTKPPSGETPWPPTHAALLESLDFSGARVALQGLKTARGKPGGCGGVQRESSVGGLGGEPGSRKHIPGGEKQQVDFGVSVSSFALQTCLICIRGRMGAEALSSYVCLQSPACSALPQHSSSQTRPVSCAGRPQWPLNRQVWPWAVNTGVSLLLSAQPCRRAHRNPTWSSGQATGGGKSHCFRVRT